MATGSATVAQELFAITELVEIVLTQLPNKDLLVAQIVCRKWRDIVKRSAPLQRALGFERSNEFKKFAARSAYTTVFGATWQSPKISHFAVATDHLILQHPYKYYLNPMVCKFITETNGQAFGTKRFEFKMECYKNEMKLDGSSAQKMYLTFPPTRKVDVRTEMELSMRHDFVDDWVNSTTITRANGVSVGDLLREVIVLIRNTEYNMNHRRVAKPGYVFDQHKLDQRGIEKYNDMMSRYTNIEPLPQSEQRAITACLVKIDCTGLDITE